MPSDSIEVTEVGCRQLLPADDDGEINVSVKATVQNNTEDSVHRPELKALDKDGFEVASVSLDGRVSPGDTQTLTTTDFVNAELFEQIVEWRVVPE